MKYYKIILDNTFIGVIHSGQFVKESSDGKKLFYSNEMNGQYVDYKGTLYKDYWMPPVSGERSYTIASILEITEEEYMSLRAAIENNEIIEIEKEDDEPVIPAPVTNEPDVTVEYARESKLKEMSATCRHTIENGFDIELRNEVQHFSLNTQDQLNLMSLSTLAQTQESIPYHADGHTCIFYTGAEINEIVNAATNFKIYHTTYYNALKNYINSLNTVESIAAIEYGTEIPEEYKTDVLKALE